MDFYDLLEISKTATPDEIKISYRKKSLTHHPDVTGGNKEKFQAIKEAYEVLSNPKTRDQYDRGEWRPSAEKAQRNSMVLEIVLMVVNAAIDQAVPQFQAFSETLYQNNIRQVNAELEQHRRVKRQAETFLPRVKTDDPDSLVVALVKNKIKQAEANITALELKISVIEEALVMLRSFSIEDLLEITGGARIMNSWSGTGGASYTFTNT